MQHYFITGTGTGLGKAMAEILCDEFKVTGISRHQTIQHKNYTHLPADLSGSEFLDDFMFNLPDEAERIVLINNAGSIGPVNRCGDLDESEINDTVHLNLTAVMRLCNLFISEAKTKTYPCLIINISSGAAAHPVPSWSVYCATKAGVDMFTRVISEELRELGISNIRAWSVYPGIIDTPMQEKIRSIDPDDFSSRIRFIEYKETGQLLPPDLTAAKILAIFKGFEWPEEVVFSIREK
jgi:benzil reductase ((S)-benzoin forming)